MEFHDDENVDLAEIEANLYAKIHHDAPETVEQYTAAALLQQNQPVSRVVTKQTVVNKAGSLPSNSQNGRYWGDGKHQPRTKVSSNKGRLNPFSVANQQGQQPNSSPPQPILPADYRPKPFTPYTSILSIDSVVNSIPASETLPDPVPTTRITQSKKPRKNMLNPFSRLNENKIQRNEKFTVKKERATKAKTKKRSKTIETISLDTSEEDEDDDVICIPVPPPPLVCIDSTDDEGDKEKPVKQQTHCDDNAVIPEDFIGQRDRSRMSQSNDVDGFGGIDDDELSYICDTVESAIRWHDSETFVTANDNTPEKITENCSPVPVNSSVEIEKNSTVCVDDSVVFVTPQKTPVGNTSKPTYEVSEHGFAAVDVYESESSDFPESVYAKGAPQTAPQIRPINASDSDCSDIQINTHNRSKRMLKRKTSSSNKGSDYKTDDGDESDDGVPFLEILKDTSTPYLQRGEAVINAKSIKHKQKLVTRRKSAPSEQSDDEFLSMLSCIVHDPDKGVLSNSTEDDPSNKTNDESSSIDARQVVEHVLRKMSKSTVPQDTEDTNWVVTDEVIAPDIEEEITTKSKESELLEEEDAAIKEGKSSLSWIVKDQVGETDNFVEDKVPFIVESSESTAEIVKTTTENVPINIAGPSEPNKLGKTDNQSVRSCSLAVDPEISWNDEMKRFYNDSWGGESFSIPAIQRNMPHRRAYEWAILPDDIHVQRRNNLNRNRNLRCINCREEGHRMQDCFMPPKQMICHMCGQTGHREPRCPQTMCLRCGNQNSVFSRGCKRCHYMQGSVCPICKTRGHVSRDCPDKWRRYHSTIDPGQPLKKQPLLVNKPRYCCICACKGHTAEYCRNALRMLDTPVPPINIYSYNDVYDPIKQEDSPEEPPRFALMSAPMENLQFTWDVDESPNRFYGRIMNTTNITRQPVIESKKKRRIENPVQMVLNPMSTINQDLNKRKKKFAKNFFEDKSSLPNIYTQNEPEESVGHAVQNVYGENEQPNKHKRFIENSEDNNMVVMPIEASLTPSNAPNALINSTVPIVIKKRPETTSVHTVKQAEINNQQEQSDVNDQLNKRKRFKDLEQQNKSLENGDQINFSFTKTLNECRDHKPNMFNLNNIFGRYSKPGDVSTPLFNASNDWINANFLNVSDHSLNESDGQVDHLMDTTLGNVRNIEETAMPFNQRHSTPNKEQQAKRITIKEKSLRNIDIDRQSVPQAPSPPSMLCESDKIAAEVKRLDQSQKFLENLKHTLSTRSSQNENVAFVVSLNEDVEEATQRSKRIRFDSDSNYSFSEFFEGEHQLDELSDSAKESTSIDDTGSNPDFIPLDNGAEEIVEDNGGISTDIRHMVEEDSSQLRPVEKTTIYLSKDHCKYLLTRSGNEFLTNANSKHSVVVRMEWSNFGNILIVEGSKRSQDNFHLDLRAYCEAYCEAAEKAAHAKRLTSQKLPRNRLSLIKFIKDQIIQLENSHGNVKELYLRMCMHKKQNNKNNNKNADRIRRSLNMILMGQTGLREGPMHLKLLQSNLKSLMLLENVKEVANPIREEVFKHYQYIFSPVEHNDYPGLLSEYEAIRKQKQRPVIELDRSLLGLKIDVTFPATAAAASSSHDPTSDYVEKKPLLLVNKIDEVHHIKAPPALIEAVKRMKKNDWIKSETN